MKNFGYDFVVVVVIIESRAVCDAVRCTAADEFFCNQTRKVDEHKRSDGTPTGGKQNACIENLVEFYLSFIMDLWPLGERIFFFSVVRSMRCSHGRAEFVRGERATKIFYMFIFCESNDLCAMNTGILLECKMTI